MERHGGTYSGPSLAAALARAAAELSVPEAEIEHEVLLGSDAEGHVLLRARARSAASPVAAFVSRVLAAMSCPATLECSHVGETLRVSVVGPEAADALGGPTVAAALADLVRKAAEKLEPGVRVELEVLGESEPRDAYLTRLAGLAVARCRRFGRPVGLPPMNPYERRLVHLTVRETSELTTESVGDGRERRIVVLPYDAGSGAGGPAEA
jgi:spoIIIJ-associated protein